MIGHHVALAPDDGLDSALFRLLDEVDRTEQIPMIGQGHRGLAELDRPVHQPIHPTTPVQQAEIGMHVQVHEIFVFVGHEKFLLKTIHCQSVHPFQGNLAHVPNLPRLYSLRTLIGVSSNFLNSTSEPSA